jgi:phospholipid/cholesterol/gamma-HCH transport system permease protein
MMTTSQTQTGYLRDRLKTPLAMLGGFFLMCVLTGKALFRWPFQWREFVLQCWFIMSVAFLPTNMVAIPLTVLLIFTLNVLLAQFGAADLSGAGAAIGAVTPARASGHGASGGRRRVDGDLCRPERTHHPRADRRDRGPRERPHPPAGSGPELSPRTPVVTWHTSAASR